MTAFPFTGTPLPGERRNLTDYRTVRYWWRKTPETTSTEQYRLRATYAFETGDFLGDAPARHTFLIGRHDIKDQADVVTAGESINNQFVTRGELASDEESDAYYDSRPRESRLNAWASDQSRPIESRAALEARRAEIGATYPEGIDPPRPPH